MKYIITLAILLVSLTVRGQVLPSDHADYAEISVGTQGEYRLRVAHEVTDKYMILQASAYVGLHGQYGLQYKMGIGYAPQGSKFRAYVFIPYFNMSLNEHAYNSPFCAEFFYWTGKLQTSVNVDVYTKGTVVVPSIRLRYQITKFRL